MMFYKPNMLLLYFCIYPTQKEDIYPTLTSHDPMLTSYTYLALNFMPAIYLTQLVCKTETIFPNQF